MPRGRHSRSRLGISIGLCLIVAAACGTTPPTPTNPASAPLANPTPTAPSPTLTTAPTPSPTATPVASPDGSIGANLVHLPMTVRSWPAAPALDSLAFVDSRHGWAAGPGIILRTVDGGATWQRQWHLATVRGVAVTAFDALHAWAIVGLPPYPFGPAPTALLRTIDGGAHWTRTTFRTPVGALDFVSPMEGWATTWVREPSAPDSRLVHTVDGGRTWQPTALPVIESVCFSSTAHGWAVGRRSVYETRDGGRSWSSTPRPSALRYQSEITLRCSGSTLWLFVPLNGSGAGGHVDYVGYRSVNGGATWRRVLGNPFYPRTPSGTPSADAEPGPFVAPDGSTAVELGVSPAGEESSVTITRDGGRHWTFASLAFAGSQASDVSFPDPSHGWVVGSNFGGSSFILATSDGGRSWRAQYPSSAPHPVGASAFVSRSEALGVGVLGDGRAVVRSTDGGRSWRRIGSLPGSAYPTPGQNGNLSFGDARHGWAVIAPGRMAATVDGGRTWRWLAAPTSKARIYEVALADARHGCIRGFGEAPGAVAFATSDGGTTWSSSDPSIDPVACAFGATGAQLAASVADLASGVPSLVIVDAETAWALVDGGLARTANGGATWTIIDWPGPSDPAAISVGGGGQVAFANSRDGLMLTPYGQIYSTADGGTTWVRRA